MILRPAPDVVRTKPFQAILPLADGKALIGGDFTFVDGTARHHIARLNANTTLDSSFDPGPGSSGTVFAWARQADGKYCWAAGYKLQRR